MRERRWGEGAVGRDREMHVLGAQMTVCGGEQMEMVMAAAAAATKTESSAAQLERDKEIREVKDKLQRARKLSQWLHMRLSQNILQGSNIKHSNTSARTPSTSSKSTVSHQRDPTGTILLVQFY